MKKENFFESDSPLIEMETQNYRPGQTGPQIPFISGITGTPYSAFPVNSGPTPYPQQPTYGNYNGLNTPQNTPAYYHPGVIQPQVPYPFAGNYMQPSGNVPFGYPANSVQSPAQFTPQQHPGYLGNPSVPQMQTPFANNQYVQSLQGQPNALPLTQTMYGTVAPTQQNPFYQPTQQGQPNGFPLPQSMYGTVAPTQQTPYYHPAMQGQVNSLPLTQPMYGNVPATQQTPYYQPAINIVDGQNTLVPNQYTPGQTRNGTSVLKNGERDFISWFPTVNILETDRFFKIEVCVPGVSKENCRIHVDKNNILRISGTRRWNQETDAVAFTKKEFSYGSFACSFLLTENMLKEKITSSCHNGLLIVSIPKREGNEIGDSTIYDISVN